jgi:hypothetical protein
VGRASAPAETMGGRGRLPCQRPIGRAVHADGGGRGPPYKLPFQDSSSWTGGPTVKPEKPFWGEGAGEVAPPLSAQTPPNPQVPGAQASSLCVTGKMPVFPNHGVGEGGRGRGQGPPGPGSTGFQPVGTPSPTKELFITIAHEPAAHPQSMKSLFRCRDSRPRLSTKGRRGRLPLHNTNFSGQFLMGRHPTRKA